MEFEDQEEQEEEISLPVSASYENSRIKMSGGGGGGGGGGVTGIGGAAGVAEGPISNRKAISKYRECLKNHAVSIGGHAVDGCGEFMAAGEEGTLDALKCAACSCHRNFHRKETAGENFHQFSPYYRTPPPGYLHIAAAAGMHHRPALALPSTSGGGAGHSREDQEDISNPSGGARKRFRTKFTQEQKDKMLAFAERLGWRIQKHDEAAVQQFCMETCVKRHVLKVWMHNNKHTLGKKPQTDKPFFT